MSLDAAELKQALADAHLPSLMMALVHLTGDASHLDGVKPVYDFFGDGQGGIAPEKPAQKALECTGITAARGDGRRAA